MVFDSKFDRAMEWLKKQDNGHGHKNIQDDEHNKTTESEMSDNKVVVQNENMSNMSDTNESDSIDKKDLPDMETIRAEAFMDYEEDEVKPGWKDVVAMVLSAFMMILPVALIIFGMVYLVAWLMFLR